MKAQVLSHTIMHKVPGGSTFEVPAYEDENGNIIASSAYRQPLTGPKIHGGHCALCSAELEPYSAESMRGVCDVCAKDDPRWT